jgi:drug/metabolite transporter (DMT)-like permease
LPVPELLDSHKGEAAALATAVCWSLTPFFFTAASLRIGAFATNVIRLVLACLFLATAVAVTGAAHAVPGRQAWMFVLSGIVGLTLGDAALFDAFVILGPRRVSLLSAVAPVIAAAASVPLLGERMSAVGLAGMALTLGGVAWVVMERGEASAVRGSLARGVTMGVLAAAGQGLGGIFAAAGLGNASASSWLGGLAAGDGGAESVTPLVGTLVRMLAGCGGMLIWAAVRGRVGEVARGTKDARALGLAAAGATFGPFIGVWFSLTAFKYTQPMAVAQTIMAFSPVLVIVIARIVHGERPSLRAWTGSIAAIAGVAVLVFRDRIAEAISG